MELPVELVTASLQLHSLPRRRRRLQHVFEAVSLEPDRQETR